MNEPIQPLNNIKFYVYCFTNKVNGKVYVGKTKNIEKRYNEHKGADGRCPAFHNAIAKYGIDGFKFHILNEYNIEKEALDAEIYYISQYRSNIRKYGYNLTEGGDGTSGYKRKETSSETRLLLSLATLGKPGHWTGKKFSDEHRHALSDGHKGVSSGMLGKTVSTETRNKMSMSHKGNSVRAKLTMLQANEIRYLYGTGNYTYSKLAKQFGVVAATICAIINGTTYQNKGTIK